MKIRKNETIRDEARKKMRKMKRRKEKTEIDEIKG